MLEMGAMLGVALHEPNHTYMHILCVRRWVVHLPPVDMLSPKILENEASLIYSLCSPLIRLVLPKVLNFIWLANLLLSVLKYILLPE